MPRLLIGLAFIAALTLAGCRVAPLYNANEITFAAPPTSTVKEFTLDDYRNAIIRAGARRGWSFKEEEPGHLVGEVTVRGKHYASVDVLYNLNQFSIVYRGSRNLNYNASRKEIHPNYNSWIKLLQQDIQNEITEMKAS